MRFSTNPYQILSGSGFSSCSIWSQKSWLRKANWIMIHSVIHAQRMKVTHMIHHDLALIPLVEMMESACSDFWLQRKAAWIRDAMDSLPPLSQQRFALPERALESITDSIQPRSLWPKKNGGTNGSNLCIYNCVVYIICGIYICVYLYYMSCVSNPILRNDLEPINIRLEVKSLLNSTSLASIDPLNWILNQYSWPCLSSENHLPDSRPHSWVLPSKRWLWQVGG